MVFQDVLLGAGLAFAATSLGALGVFLFKNIRPRDYAPILTFSGGVMVFSVMEMFNESHALAGNSAFFGLVLGLIAFMVIERLLPHAHILIRKRALHNSKKKAVLLAGTMTLHNVPEGFAIASAFAVSPALGWLVTTSISIQDIPEGLVASAPLACCGVSHKRSVFWGVFSGFAEFVAAIFGYLFLSLVCALVPFALSFSAGAMTYVVFFELLPDALRGPMRNMSILAFLFGIAAAFGLSLMFV